MYFGFFVMIKYTVVKRLVNHMLTIINCIISYHKILHNWGISRDRGNSVKIFCSRSLFSSLLAT